MQNSISQFQAGKTTLFYLLQSDQIYVGSENLFVGLFGEARNQYYHAQKCKELCAQNVVVVGKETYLPINGVNDYLMQYSVPKAKYLKCPTNYAAYIEFVQSDTLNKILAMHSKGAIEVPSLDFMSDTQPTPTKTRNAQKTAHHAPKDEQVEDLKLHTSLQKIEFETIVENLKSEIDNLRNKNNVLAQEIEDKATEIQMQKDEFEKENTKKTEQNLQVSKQSSIFAKQVETLQDELNVLQQQKADIEQKESSLQNQLQVLQVEKSKKETALQNALKEQAATQKRKMQILQDITEKSLKTLQDKSAKELQELQDVKDLQIKELETQLLAAQKPQTKLDLGAVLREKLTNRNVFMILTILVTAAFLPFTFLAIQKYITIETTNMVATIGVSMLCLAMAIIWDGSILVFAVNGKDGFAFLGSFFQLIFFSAKFDYIVKWAEILGSANPVFIQEMVVVTAVVLYSPLLVAQFTKLATSNLASK